jgi:tyrosinase
MITRRTLLQTTAAAGAAMTFTGVLPGLRAAAQPIPLRRSLQDMDLDDPDLQTLREFVTMMKDPSRNGQPLSWVGFAEVHGSFAVGFNLCPHGNWYFLPWHRGYIRMYEVAARALTGNNEFAMPYWDWTAQPDFPAAFGDATFDGQPNPLFVAGRLLETGDLLDENTVGQAVMDEVYDLVGYEEFGSSRPPGQTDTDPSWIMTPGIQGPLEFNPHNNVHCDIRGPFMCTGASPQDPIFMMHHGNIDRVWAQWISLGRSNSTDPLWLDMPFTDNFIDPSGNTYTDVVNQLLEVEPLGYTYGLVEPKEPSVYYDPGRYLYLSALYGAPVALESAAQRLIVRDLPAATPTDPLSVTLQPDMAALERAIAPSSASALEAAGVPPRQVYAFIRQMAPTESETTQLRVFVNLPDATPSTPTTDPHFVTTIGFFGPSEMHGGQDLRPSAAVNLTSALRRIASGGELASDQLTVQLVPVPRGEGAEAGAGSVTPAEVELAIV